MSDHQYIINQTKNWIEKFVIKLNLCPFAAVPFTENKIRYVVSKASEIEELAANLALEFHFLQKHSSDEIETSFLIHPNILQDFYDYNDFLDLTTWMLANMKLEGIIQIAGFHPHYCFAETSPDDVSNYTNRSPYPMLHLLREDSISKATAHYPHTDKIPERNIQLLYKLGLEEVRRLR